jgi:uncharacterized damage-inducible protein DinB
MATTRRVLERLPDEHLAWKPHEKSMSLGDLATHVVNIPTWAGITVDTAELDMGQEFPPPPTGRRAELLEIFDRHVSAARAKIESADDHALMQTWALKMGGQVLLEMPKVAVLRSFVLSHLIHHRGQLSVYLRLKDVPLPPIYGPSADEQGF